jgi:hypothetical protein
VISFAPLLAKEENQNIHIYLSEIEVQEIFNNPDRAYVYLGKEVSLIAQVITEISILESNKNSLVWSLTDHIEKGFVIGNYDAVLQSLKEAQIVLLNNADVLDGKKALALSNSLNEIIEQVTANNLSLNARMLAFLKDSLKPTNNECVAK